jgi:hypothetical protein
MHKYTWLVLSAATLLLLTGCGKTPAQQETTTPTTATTAVTEATTVPETTQATQPQESGTDLRETQPENTEPTAPEVIMGVGKRDEDYGEETTPAETKPQETKPVETEPVETEPVETEPVVTEPLETEPVETVPVETKPEETKPEETKPQTAPDAVLTYAEFLEMSEAEQDAFTESFDSLHAFIQWHNADKAVYDAENTPVGTIGPDGSIDLGVH